MAAQPDGDNGILRPRGTSVRWSRRLNSSGTLRETQFPPVLFFLLVLVLLPRTAIIKRATCEHRPRSGHRILVADPMLPSRRSDDHAVRAHARTAARIAAERSMPSRLARAISSANSSSENRVVTT